MDLMWILSFVLICFNELVSSMDPSFDVPTVNVTVIAGKTAILPCSVDHLRDHQVAWVDRYQAVLTHQDRRIIDDTRISLERPYKKEWNLHIRNVRYHDKGEYTCQINTEPIKTLRVYLDVLVAARIIDHLSSDDTTAREGDTVTLVCNVTGVPPVTVNWYRRPFSGDDSRREKIGISGEVLIIHNISRWCDDIYECSASNGVAPPVSRKIEVTVEFPPEVRLPTKRIGQSRGKETILQCIIAANPQGVTVWERFGREITKSLKYRVELYNEEDETITLNLHIRTIDEYDYGEYRCVAKNRLGEDSEIMLLYDHTARVQTTTPPSLWTEPPATFPLETTRGIPIWTAKNSIVVKTIRPSGEVYYPGHNSNDYYAEKDPLQRRKPTNPPYPFLPETRPVHNSGNQRSDNHFLPHKQPTERKGLCTGNLLPFCTCIIFELFPSKP